MSKTYCGHLPLIEVDRWKRLWYQQVGTYASRGTTGTLNLLTGAITGKQRRFQVSGLFFISTIVTSEGFTSNFGRYLLGLGLATDYGAMGT